MLFCVDVGYQEDQAIAAGLVFQDWPDTQAMREITRVISPVEPYVSGEFYRRELPCILHLLQEIPEPATIIVDGYVWLGGTDRPGLGAHLYGALDGKIPVVGVSKNPFHRASPVAEVCRGQSERPLFVSAVGMPLDQAATSIQAMDGSHRIPTLLKRVDQLSRGLAAD